MRLYLPRVINADVVLAAIRDGLAQLLPDETFALASTYDEANQRYLGLQQRSPNPVLDSTALLVKPSVAQAQLEADEAARKAKEAERKAQDQGGNTDPGGDTKPDKPRDSTGPAPGGDVGGGPVKPPEPPEESRPTRFFGSAKLDGCRVGREAGRIADEVLGHLTTLPGAEVEITLDVQIRIPDGINEEVVRTVSENANTLKFDQASFEKD